MRPRSKFGAAAGIVRAARRGGMESTRIRAERPGRHATPKTSGGRQGPPKEGTRHGPDPRRPSEATCDPPRFSIDAGVVARNVATIAALERQALAHRSAAERLADRIAQTTGTLWFAILHAGWFGAWLLVNVGVVPGIRPFDPFPFSFLTLVVSLEAIFLTIFVLMSQNGMARRADRRAQLDLQINLLAEQESTRTVDLLRRIADHLQVPIERTATEGALARPTDIEDVMSILERKLPAE
jgi:uncharacterized membrane protein